MSEELQILKDVAERLNGADIPYMISGSVATWVQKLGVGHLLKKATA